MITSIVIDSTNEDKSQYSEGYAVPIRFENDDRREEELVSIKFELDGSPRHLKVKREDLKKLYQKILMDY